MKKLIISAVIAVQSFIMCCAGASAATTHTVVSGDSMWKIAVKYQVGLSEIISANPQISNPELIYPGQIINIPSVNSQVREFEREVIRLVNEQRVKNGLSELKEDWELSRVARFNLKI